MKGLGQCFAIPIGAAPGVSSRRAPDAMPRGSDDGSDGLMGLVAGPARSSQRDHESPAGLGIGDGTRHRARRLPFAFDPVGYLAI